MSELSTRTLSVLVENKPGVLARVSSLIFRRGFNIESLAVGPTEYPHMSRITLAVTVDDLVLELVQLFRAKVVDVAADAVTIQIVGNQGKLEDFLRVIEPYGVRELVQSGVVAIGRGGRSITERALRPVPVPVPAAAG